jgi:hypothetical protein
MANFRIEATVSSIKLENNLIPALSMRKDAMCALMILGLYSFFRHKQSDTEQIAKRKHTSTRFHKAANRTYRANTLK